MADSVLLANTEVLADVGRQRAARLRDAGAGNIAELLAGGAKVAKAAGSAETLARWRAAATLLTLDGVTPQIAAALAEAGTVTTQELAEMSLRTLERTVEEAGVADPPSVYELASFQQAAWRRARAGMLAVEACDRNGNPIRGATIRVAGRTETTSRDGWAAFDAVPEGRHRVELTTDRVLVPFGVVVTVQAGRLTGPVRLRLPTKRKSVVATKPRRQSDGAPVSNRGVRATRVRTVPLSALRDGTYLVVRPALEDDRVPLVSLDKIRSGFDLIIERVVVDRAALPAETAERALVQLNAGRLERTDRTPADVTRAWMRPVVRRKRRMEL